MKTKISAEIVAHSINEQGDELISVLATFPRIILAEVNTHRMLSKNTSSSRAIPFAKMVDTIQNDPFIPIAWQKPHSGMQGSEYATDVVDIAANVSTWLHGRDRAIATAWGLNEGVTKQLCNRLLEPFMWTTMLITGPKSGWDNFFNLRCPSYEVVPNAEDPLMSFRSKQEIFEISDGQFDDWTELDWLKVNKGQAEIHIMALAECIWDAYNESDPKVLTPGEWHIPFSDKIQRFANIPLNGQTSSEELESNILINKVKVSVAMAARTSYTVVGEEKGIDIEAMVALHDRLLAQDPPHSSPLEHCAQAMSKEERFHFTKTRPAFTEEEKNKGNEVADFGWCNNLKGFIPYRYIIDNSLSL